MVWKGKTIKPATTNRIRGVRLAVLLAVGLCCFAQSQAQQFKASGNTDPKHQPAPWKQGEVVVTFDTMPTRVSFDLPGHIKLISENGIPYTNGATETYIKSEGFHEGASYESWNDKNNKYSRMWIESQNDARIVVRHRCALIKGDKICHQDKPKVAPYGPGNWTDEWYIFHPDGTHTRRVKIWSAVAGESGRHGAKYPYELEGMYLWWGSPCKGKTASDHLEDGAITLIKMNGAHKTINLNPYPLKKNEYQKMSGVYGEFSNANIHVINTKSKYRPWRMGRWSKTLSVTPYVPVHKQVQLVPCFPEATTEESGYSVAGLGQMNWGGFWKRTDTTISEIWLNGFTTSREPAKELAALARSWQQAPKMTAAGGSGVAARGYSIGDLAYLIDATNPGRAKEIQGVISASEKSPLINPAFLINNWGKAVAELEIKGKAIPRGKDFRTGYYKTLALEDGRKWTDVLVVWARVNFSKPVQFKIRSKGYAFSGAAALAAVEKLVADKQYIKAAAQLRRLAASQRDRGVGKQAVERLEVLLADPVIGRLLIDAEANALETRGAAAESKRDYPLAIKLYEQYVRQFPKARQLKEVKAHLASLKSDKTIQAAVRNSQAAVECKRWQALADSYAASGLADKAKQQLTKIIEKYGDTAWAAKARVKLAEIDGK
ncbi:MAG: hypothetical protein QGH60_17700 [Phycisphaerae bacterium]|jgi:hypothetical protein|nr:hypothetical protein [Phycisphaerae bacterium]